MAVWKGPLENLGMNLFGTCYSGRRILITGHTGFKGSWLAYWLQQLGADVVGIALPPEQEPNHWNLLKLKIEEHQHDIRDAEGLARLVKRARPDAIFHLAAQSLVRRSYREPLQTWSTNVLGTAALLEACRDVDALKAVVVVTTDKCYENVEQVRGYTENDRLGGHDPYSASKAGAELVVASYRRSFFSQGDVPLIATARAGNVIGGGDWAEDRLIPDLARAQASKSELEVRSPLSTRPWQHVLEPLSGYLLLGQKLLQGNDRFAQAWNFGPDAEGNLRVVDLLELMRTVWPSLAWRQTTSAQPHEAALLQLDIGKARRELSWCPVWTLDEGVRATAQWYEQYLSSGALLTNSQLDNYLADAKAAGLGWALA